MSLVIALLAVTAPAALDAQGTAQVRPSGRAWQPVIVIGDHATWVVGAPDAIVAATDSAAVARALAACRVTLSTDVVTRRLVRPDEATRGAYVVFMAVPRAAVAPDCDASVTEGAALLASGIRMAGAVDFDERRDLVGASLRIDGGPWMSPDSVQLEPTIVASPSGGLARTVPMMAVLTVPAAMLAPDARGEFADVTLGTTTRHASPAESLTVYRDHVRRAWLQLLPARLAALREDAGRGPATSLPAPTDTALRAAHSAYAGGRVVGAARAAAGRLYDDALSRDDRRVARLIVADALLAGGDSVAARAVLADVLRNAPCLTLASAAAEYSRELDAVRPIGARCEPVPMARVASAALVPGLGYATIGRRRAAWQVAGGTALLGAVSLGLRALSNARYDRYLEADSEDHAVADYGRAADLRTLSNGVAGAAVVVWVATGIDALRAARAQRVELARQRAYGRAEGRVSTVVAPVRTPAGTYRALHLGVAWAW